MPAYLILQIAIGDADRWRKYRDAVLPLIAKFGGTQLVRGGAVEVLEGHHGGQPIAMFEFPSMDSLHAFWNSPEYVPVKELRRGAAVLDAWAVPGA